MMTQKFDCHTHILPGMDDGAADINVSVNMIKSLVRQGVRVVALTPHYDPMNELPEQFARRRQNAYAHLREATADMPVRLVLASETFLGDYLFNAQDISQLCFDQGRYIMIEFSFESTFSRRTIDRINRLISGYNVIPVLAHVERYPTLMNDFGLLDYLIQLGCRTQINLESLTAGLHMRKTAIRLIRKGLAHAVGTDCHNMDSRSPEYDAGRRVILDKIGVDAWETLQRGTLSILDDQPLCEETLSLL